MKAAPQNRAPGQSFRCRSPHHHDPVKSTIPRNPPATLRYDDTVRHIPLVLAALVAAALLAGAVALLPGHLDTWRRKLFPSTAGNDYSWLSASLEACEKEAAADPGTLYFMVVPLTATRRFDTQLADRALGTAGTTVLFSAGDTFDGLNRGVFRISSDPFVLIALDEANKQTRRWSSATGVTKLTWPAMTSDGPFRVRLQTSPDDTVENWSTVTADGRGSCHWVHALLKR